MNTDQLYSKAARLLDLAIGEELMRRFYEDLARSYYRMASEMDREHKKRHSKNSKTADLSALTTRSLGCWCFVMRPQKIQPLLKNVVVLAWKLHLSGQRQS